MLSFKSLKLAYGSKILFDNATINLYKNQRIGLVGQNGVGKTSLFKLLLGKLSQDAGEYSLSNNTLISYVEQEIENDMDSLVDYVLSQHPLVINEQFDLPEYYRLQPNAEKLLINLGFKENELYLPLRHFSGGWQMRANLAKALLVPSDLLLLDEPTNHLDVETVMWLEDWLRKFSGLLIIISHDREFLDNVTTHTLSISGKQLVLYTGNYSTYEHIRYLQYEQHAKMIEKNQQKVAKLQVFVDKFRAKASKAKQAQSKLKMIEKLKVTESLPRDIEYSIEFMEPEHIVDKLIGVENASFGYAEKNLLSGVNFDIFQTSRVGLLGRNGVGKSTFIKGLIDGSTKLSGNIYMNGKIKIGYFTQNTVDSLDLEDTPLGFFKRNNPGKKESELRSYLGKYGFTMEKVNEKIRHFSGGEKARLSIANIIYQRPNLLFLDEPTNHLDMQMREELAEAIQEFNGGLVIVSHDKFLLQSIVDEFYLIKMNKLVKFDGDLEDYHQILVKLGGEALEKPKITNVHLKSGLKQEIAKKQKIIKELTMIEKDLAKINLKIKKYLDDMSEVDITDVDNISVYREQNHKYGECLLQLSKLEDRWIELQGQLDGWGI